MELMSEFPVDQESVQTRGRIVLPLLIIQQYALMRLRDVHLSDGGASGARKTCYQVLVRDYERGGTQHRLAEENATGAEAHALARA